MDEMKLARAREVYALMCQALDNKGWKYNKDEEKLVVYLGVNGDDIPLRLVMFVDAEKQKISLLSPLPFKMSEAKLLEGAVMTCVATYGLSDGCFEYDLTDGSITFRLTAGFLGSHIGEGLIHYMIDCACAVVDNYNDRFLAVDKDLMSLADFIDKEA